MAKKIAVLLYNGRMNLPDEKENGDAVEIAELFDLLRLEVIDFVTYNNDHGVALDKQNEYSESPLLNDETIFKIRLDVHLDTYTTYDNTGRNLMRYIAHRLGLCKAHVSNCYQREYENFVQTCIEITISAIKKPKKEQVLYRRNMNS